MSHRILNVNVSLQSINQPQLCEEMLEAMTRDDRDSLLIVTSTKKISVSSKMLQIFSPLYRDILRDIPIKDGEPVTMILPDTESVNVQHLLDLLTSGKVRGTARAGDILTLAECFKIELRETDLAEPLKDMEKEQPPRIRVKKLEEMSSPVPSESLNADEARKPDSRNPPNNILIDDEKVVEEDRGRCSFCHKLFYSKFLKIHEEDHCRVRRSAHLPYKCHSCGIRYLNEEKLFNHMQKKHYQSHFLFHCSICDRRFQYQLPLKQHITKAHKNMKIHSPVNFVYKFSEGEGPPSCFYETILR